MRHARNARKRSVRRVATWHIRDSVAACSQGWAIFDSGIGDGPDGEWTDPRLCLDNDASAFATEDDAFRFIVATAERGNRLAARALRFLARVNPEHHARIMLIARAELAK